MKVGQINSKSAFYSYVHFILIPTLLTVCIGKESGLYTEELVGPILTCLSDADSRVRYYACESLYNVVKVAPPTQPILLIHLCSTKYPHLPFGSEKETEVPLPCLLGIPPISRVPTIIRLPPSIISFASPPPPLFFGTF